MSALEASDFPDLDMLLNAAENRCGDSAGDGDCSDKGPFDPNEYAGVVQWYNEQTQNIQQHYDTHLEYQKQKLAEENEAGLLEALQQSLDTIESDHMSDFASLSSSLDQPYFCTSTTKPSPVSSDCDLVEEPSMLKKLLLSPSNENYPKELSSPILSDRSSSRASDFGKIKISSPAQSSTSSQDGDWKPYTSKKKKPFMELLKHMKANGNRQSTIMESKKGGTRFVNTKRYMRKYGSAPCSRESTPPEAPVAKKARIIIHPVSGANSVVSTLVGNEGQKTKPVILSSMPVTSKRKIYFGQALTSETASTVTNMTPCAGKRSNTHKHSTAVLIDPLPVKQARVEPDCKIMKTSDSPQSCDHDYCTVSGSALCSTTGPMLCVTTAIVSKCSDTPASSDGSHIASSEFALPEKRKPEVKPASTKILKWEDYLQRVRAGTRSAPNSPTCSPKVTRGSARVPNNFMVVSMQEARKLLGESAVTSAGNLRLCSNHSERLPDNRQQLKLQGFEEYMTLLQKSLSAPDTSSDGITPPLPSSTASAAAGAKLSVSVEEVAKSTDTPATNALTAIIQRKYSEDMLRNRAVENMKHNRSSNSQLLRIGSNVRLLQTNVSGNKTINVKSTPISGSSGRMLMIHVPPSSGHAATIPIIHEVVSNAPTSSSQSGVLTNPSSGQMCATVQGAVTSAHCSVAAASKIPVSNENSSLPSDPRVNGGDRGHGLVKDLKIPAMMLNWQTEPEQSTGNAPMFKLVTSNKEGVETKSLILSGVTGQLKEILMLLAKQQAAKKELEKNSLPVDATIKEEQQLTLQKLLSAISSLNTLYLDKTPEPLETVFSVEVPKVMPLRKLPAVPSPLTLIHEIKQNFSKMNEVSVCAADESVSLSTPKWKAGGVATSVDRNANVLSMETRMEPTRLAPSTKTVLDDCTKPMPALTRSSPSTNLDSGVNSVNGEVKTEAAQAGQSVEKPGSLQRAWEQNLPGIATEKFINENQNYLKAPGVLKDYAPNTEEWTSQTPNCTKLLQDVTIDFSTAANTVSPARAGVAQSIQDNDSLFPSLRPKPAGTGAEGNLHFPETPVKFSMTRSMAAAEMLASDVVDDGIEEILVFNNSKVLKAAEGCGVTNEVDDPDPAVITLEEAMASLEDDEVLNQSTSSPKPSTLSQADQLFCKLPSYFLTGKLVPEVERRDAVMDGLKRQGLKNLQCDPLINAESSDEVEFNKLPHYFSSGKRRPRSMTSSSEKGKLARSSPRLKREAAVKFTTVGENQLLTPAGTPVNDSETFYSRLPSYYSYGRPHPAVKTFNDEVADDKDDTVTPELLNVCDSQPCDQDGVGKAAARRKSKRKKRRKRKMRDRSADKILHSKLPSYYMSGRAVPSGRDGKYRSRSRSSSPSVRSSSSDALYRSSGNSPKRSRSRNSRRSRRRNSRSLSSHTSSSSSRSMSPCNSDESSSWRRGGRSRTRGRGAGRQRKTYEHSDDESVSRIRRKRDYQQERRLAQEAKEKKQQHAMEERRVVYVGRIEETMTRSELRLKFIRFGTIEAVSLHFREDGDNYGFVTFQYTCDAFRAIEEGNLDLAPGEKEYVLCFGGRRQFCKTAYEDLDSKLSSPEQQSGDLDDFDALLRQAKRNIHR